jgi:glutaredoxin
MLTIYTKDQCFYCKNLKKNLDKWGMSYQEVNISNREDMMKWFKSAGHTTVPQLYFDGVDVQRGESTALTRQDLEMRIERVQWPSIDSGIE